MSRPLDRRAWMTLGGLHLGALAAAAGPNLAALLAADGAGPKPDGDFSVILFWANGGPSHLDTFDLKPDAPAEVRGPFKPVRTNTVGVQISEHLPRLAGLADKFALVRSLHHNRAEHSGGTHRFLTGYPSVAANLTDAEYPDVGSVVSKRLSGRDAGVPTFVANTKAYGSGPGYLGPAYAPFMPRPDPITSTGANAYDPVPLHLAADGRAGLSLDPEGTVTLRRRDDLRRSLDALPRALDDRAGPAAEFGRYQRRAVELLSGPRTRAAFDLSREDPRVLARYGDSDWGRDLLTARRLVEAGVRFVQCQANVRLRPGTGRITTWDDHSVNCDIFKAYEERMPLLDRAAAALIDDLYQRGLDRHVLFVFCGEFGRTPRIAYQDPSRRPGRDHWPRAMSVLLAGGGLRMGQAVGATNARGEEPTARAMDSNCLLATIYHRFGIDTAGQERDRAGRPIPILPECEPIAELVGR
ncbi:DUF1501 domain-containing protein [Urbifossiella limnaea]|uniref:DUF1501 domain-containing protein n=1 Tax=Urbifossiella limnaea TaxID=2528023 RepID=A0A517Y165_9BACT|nr:DUF1501 domain-containing protein [Urbifossiella limnaea]QDU23507.1 hypothetical protein ETAA1_55070 [Urbifossiella limnaea]